MCVSEREEREGGREREREREREGDRGTRRVCSKHKSTHFNGHHLVTTYRSHL